MAGKVIIKAIVAQEDKKVGYIWENKIVHALSFMKYFIMIHEIFSFGIMKDVKDT